MTSRLRRLLRPFAPRYEALGLATAPGEVRVELEADGTATDVTTAHVAASLRPFAIAVGYAGGAWARLVVRRAGAEVGAIELERVAPNGSSEVAILRRGAVHDGRAARRSIVGLRGRDLDDRAVALYYVLPRPVGIVALATGALFPMDLVGPLGTGRFALALRRESRALGTIRATRRLAWCLAPAARRETVYELGRFHTSAGPVDPPPFGRVPSPRFHLSCPDFSLAIAEIEVDATVQAGSHVLLVGRSVAESRLAPGPALFHRVAGPVGAPGERASR